MRLTVVKRLCAALLVGGVAVAIPVAAASGHDAHGRGNDHIHHGRGDHGGPGGSQIKHVLLISVDGMHQSDLNWYIANHPDSELAKLSSGGAEFTNNHTSDPSDSDPGGTALMTGGDSRATGVYYDVEYSHGTDEPAVANGARPARHHPPPTIAGPWTTPKSCTTSTASPRASCRTGARARC
jgi:hypothetical protein